MGERFSSAVFCFAHREVSHYLAAVLNTKLRTGMKTVPDLLFKQFFDGGEGRA